MSKTEKRIKIRCYDCCKKIKIRLVFSGGFREQTRMWNRCPHCGYMFGLIACSVEKK